MPNGNGDPKRKRKRKARPKAKKRSGKNGRPKGSSTRHKAKAVGNAKVVQELCAYTPKKEAEPQVVIDWEAFENLCHIQCTQVEIADWFRCGLATLKVHVKEHYGETFQLVYAAKKGKGKIALRRAQLQTALGNERQLDKKGKIVKEARAPNPTMLIWMGKQTLDQSDKPGKIDHGGTVGHEHYGTIDFSKHEAGTLRELLRGLESREAGRAKEPAQN